MYRTVSVRTILFYLDLQQHITAAQSLWKTTALGPFCMVFSLQDKNLQSQIHCNGSESTPNPRLQWQMVGDLVLPGFSNPSVSSVLFRVHVYLQPISARLPGLLGETVSEDLPSETQCLQPGYAHVPLWDPTHLGKEFTCPQVSEHRAS